PPLGPSLPCAAWHNTYATLHMGAECQPSRRLCFDARHYTDDLPVITPCSVAYGAKEVFQGALPIGEEAAEPKRPKQLFELQKDGVLPPPKDLCQHGPPGVSDGVPQPPRLCLLAPVTPHQQR